MGSARRRLSQHRVQPEGSLLTGGHDASASLWEESGKRISQFKNCDTAAFRVVFTSAQNPLVGDWSGDVREWTPGGTEVRVLSARDRQ